jgi:hypothetical protein
MITCDPCQRAEAHPHSGLYQSGCIGCEARAIANGPEAHAREADPGPLQAAMRRVWSDDAKYRQGRTMVWEWLKRAGQA